MGNTQGRTESGDSQDHGICFIDASTNVGTEFTRMMQLIDSRAVFTVPENVAHDRYTIVVKRAFDKEVREGRLADNANVMAGNIR